MDGAGASAAARLLRMVGCDGVECWVERDLAMAYSRTLRAVVDPAAAEVRLPEAHCRGDVLRLVVRYWRWRERVESSLEDPGADASEAADFYHTLEENRALLDDLLHASLFLQS
jgi:hypothetical protein